MFSPLRIYFYLFLPGRLVENNCDLAKMIKQSSATNRVTHGINKHTVNNTIEKRYIYSVCKLGKIREVRQ